MAVNFSTENLARVSATHPWKVLGIWALVLLGAFVMVVNFLDSGLTTKFEFVNEPEVKRGEKLLEEMRGPKGTSEIVVFQSAVLTVDDPEYRETVVDLTSKIEKLGSEIIRLETLGNFYDTNSLALVSDDRSATLVAFVMAGDFDTNSDNIDEVVDVVHDFANEHSKSFDVMIAGQATIGLDQREITQKDLEKGEAFGVPLALIILIVVLGAIAAAVIPLVMAIVSIVIALGVSALIGTMFELSLFVSNIITTVSYTHLTLPTSDLV